MTITEKVAYLKGLVEGLGVDNTTKEGKLFTAIVDVLDDMALTVADLEDEYAELSEQVDCIDDDLDAIEKDYYDEDDEDASPDFYEFECPHCGKTVYFDEDLLDEESIVCPECGERVELEFEDEHGCGCGCGCEDEDGEDEDEEDDEK